MSGLPPAAVEADGAEATRAPRSPVRLPQSQPKDVNKNLEVHSASVLTICGVGSVCLAILATSACGACPRCCRSDEH